MKNYSHCDCLFKKFQQLYIDSRNRFICGSSRNVENNNLRIPMLFSKYALKAKWLYFNTFTDNKVPDEKVSVDLLAAINPLLAALPFARNNDNVLPCSDNLLNYARIDVVPDLTFVEAPKVSNIEKSYRKKVSEYMDNIDTAEQMLLYLYDYSNEYYPVCLGLYKVLSIMRAEPSKITTSHGRETIRKIYDVFYQMKISSKNKN